jgi:hypothetical protein
MSSLDEVAVDDESRNAWRDWMLARATRRRENVRVDHERQIPFGVTDADVFDLERQIEEMRDALAFAAAELAAMRAENAALRVENERLQMRQKAER